MTGIQTVLNAELIRRLLTKYFLEKGFNESFDDHLYPPLVQDISARIPELMNKIEIVPFVEELDPTTGEAKIGWNLFVLGTNRMALGKSSHRSAIELQRAFNSSHAEQISQDTRKVKDIIEFVIKILSNSKSGIVDPRPKMPAQAPTYSGVSRPRIGPTASGGYYERQRPVN